MNLLLLAGTAEARAIAAALAGRPGLDVTASLAGATRQPGALPVACRIGGFGGAGAFRDWLCAHRIDAVIDATHPFAERISARSAAVCAEAGIPYLQLLRPGWTPDPGDRWTMIAREEQAADIIRPPATVFLATGRQTLARFAGLSGCRLICRQIDPPDGPFPFPNGEFLVGQPPFSVSEERALFARLGIDWLVVKNAGGAASRSKLDAARELGLPVLMIARPALAPGAERAETVAETLAWLERLP